ncbi:MAG: hypothetical protein ACE5JS_08530 [Nitrospinota bacterium]
MDWSLLKGILEGVVLLVFVPGATYYLLRTQKRQIEDRTRQLEEQRRLLEEKDCSLRDLQVELSAEKEKFCTFTSDLLARNRQAWNRLLEEESTLVQASQEQGVFALEKEFEGFKSKLANVQQDLENFRRALMGTFQAFHDERRKSLEARGIPPFVHSELAGEMQFEYLEGSSDEVLSPSGDGVTSD